MRFNTRQTIRDILDMDEALGMGRHDVAADSTVQAIGRILNTFYEGATHEEMLALHQRVRRALDRLEAKA